jgi:hypothetical protein
VLDTNDLRDRIRKLKVQQQELNQTIDDLNNEIAQKEKKLNDTKYARMVVDPDPELRMHPVDGNADDSDLIDDVKFRVMNEKLEMQILINEIRNSLRPLEKEVRYKEVLANKGAKSAAKAGKSKTAEKFPVLFLDFESIEEKLKELMDDMIRSKRERTEYIEQERQINQNLSEQIAKYRVEYARAERERDSLRLAIATTEKTWKLDYYRDEILRKSFVEQREKLRKLHGGFGWQTFLFQEETQTNHSEEQVPSAANALASSIPPTIHITRIPTLLKPWICPKPGKYGQQLVKVDWANMDFLRQQLQIVKRAMGRNTSSSTTTRSYTLDDEHIDLNTFCLLCDHIVAAVEGNV